MERFRPNFKLLKFSEKGRLGSRYMVAMVCSPLIGRVR